MTEEMTSLAVEDAPNPGTVSFTPEPKEVKPPTAREAIEKSLQAIEEKEGKIPEADELRDKKPEPKPKVEAKAEPKEEEPEPKQAKERAPDGKFAPRDAQIEQAKEDEADQRLDAPKPPAGERDISRAPDNFLPRAKEKWADAPEEVRGEFYRALENFEKGKAEYQEDREFRKAIKPYEEMAKQYGTSVPNYLENTLRINQHLSQDLVGGLDVIARQYGYTLEQVAQHITQQAQVQQQNPQLAHTQRLEQQVAQLQQQLQSFAQFQQQATEQQAKAEAIRQVENTLFAEVRKDHPRFDELRTDIAFFFNSDKLSSIADERSRLYAAVDMAERVNPVPQSYTSTRNAQRPINPAGEKSIKGSLTSGTDVYAAKGAKLNGREAIEAAMNQLDLR